MWTIPNILTAARATAVLPVTWAVLAGAWPFAFGLFVAAALTDYLDGWLARRWNQVSEFGRFLDPIADKLMVAGAGVALTDVRAIADTDIWPLVVILVRELLVAGLREHLGPKGVVVHVSGLAKWKTAAQLIALATILLSLAWPDYGPQAHRIGIALLWTAAALTAWTGLQYLVGGMKHMRAA